MRKILFLFFIFSCSVYSQAKFNFNFYKIESKNSRSANGTKFDATTLFLINKEDQRCSMEILKGRFSEKIYGFIHDRTENLQHYFSCNDKKGNLLESKNFTYLFSIKAADYECENKYYNFDIAEIKDYGNYNFKVTRFIDESKSKALD